MCKCTTLSILDYVCLDFYMRHILAASPIFISSKLNEFEMCFAIVAVLLCGLPTFAARFVVWFSYKCIIAILTHQKKRRRKIFHAVTPISCEILKSIFQLRASFSYNFIFNCGSWHFQLQITLCHILLDRKMIDVIINWFMYHNANSHCVNESPL